MADCYVKMRATATWAATTAYVLGDLVKDTADTKGKHFECTTAGTSGGSEPTWDTTIGNTTSDSTVVWTARTGPQTWQASTAYTLGARIAATDTYTTAERRGVIYECTTAGTSGSSEPTWPASAGGTVASGTAVFTRRSPTSWANACLHLYNINSLATSLFTSGDTIWVSSKLNYISARTSTTTYNFPAAASTISPNRVLSVDATGEPSPPTTLLAGATYGETGPVSLGGTSYHYGLTYQLTGGTSTTAVSVGPDVSSTGWMIFEDCTLKSASTGSGARIRVGARLINTGFHIAHTDNNPRLITGGLFEWFDTATPYPNLVPTGAIISLAGADDCRVLVSGVNFSACNGAGNSIVAWPAASSLTEIREAVFRNCRIPAICFTNQTYDLANHPTRLSVYNCNETGNTGDLMIVGMGHFRLDSEKTIVRTGGASDGTTTISWKVQTGTRINQRIPFSPPDIVYWNTNVTTAQTATIEFIHDSLTALTDAEIWLEVEYMGTSGQSVTSLITDAPADILTTPTNQDTSAETWTTTGMTNPNGQKLNVTFTCASVGLVTARVRLAKASYTVYIDPKVVVS